MNVCDPVSQDRFLKSLFFARNEKALEICSEKYGKLFYRIALNITGNRETSEEIVNDTYLKLWNSIPPAEPESFSAYGSVTARNLAISRVRSETAAHRPQVVCELDEALPAEYDEEIPAENLEKLLNLFLEKLKDTDRVIFIERYFYEDTSEAIALRFGMSAGGVRNSLKRSRDKLRVFLEDRGYKV